MQFPIRTELEKTGFYFIIEIFLKVTLNKKTMKKNNGGEISHTCYQNPP